MALFDDLWHRPTRFRAGRAVAAFGGTALAALSILTAGAGTASAATPAEMLTAECVKYVPNPVVSIDPAVPSDVSDCRNADLAGMTMVDGDPVDLTGANLTGADLSFGQWVGTILAGANLAGANLSDGRWIHVDLSGANVTRADVSGGQWYSVTLAGANLADSSLRSGVWEGVNLANAHLTGADLTDSTWINVHLAGANLTGAFLVGGRWIDVNLSNSDLTDANLAGVFHMGAPNFFQANLTRANLSDAQLQGAYLGGANLTNANLTRLDLTDAYLLNANLTGTSAIPADISVPAESAVGTTVTWPTPTVPVGLTFGACTPASGAPFPAGTTTTVTCSVGDAWGTFTVTVGEAPAPEPPVTPGPPASGSPGMFGSS